MSSSNVIEFHRPKPRPAAPKPPVLTFSITGRDEWKEAVAAAWADPARWKVSRHGNSYVVLEEIGVVVVIERHEDTGYFSWTIRFRDGREPVRSKWTYTGERIALDEALDAVIVLA